MRVLLDACVPKGLRGNLSGHQVRTAPEMGWGDLDNGDLLDAMTSHFDALVTVDKNFPHQQQIKDRPVGVVVLRAKSNRLSERAEHERGAADRFSPGLPRISDGQLLLPAARGGGIRQDILRMLAEVTGGPASAQNVG